MHISGKRVLLGFLIFGLGIQLIHPAHTNPPSNPAKSIDVSGHMPPEVSAIINRSCKDCHTYATTWPWYSHVAPMSWLVAWDVNNGRRKVSMSTWADYDAKAKSKRLDDICENVQSGDMPESWYVMVHESAALTDKDKQAVCAWAKQEAGGR